MRITLMVLTKITTSIRIVGLLKNWHLYFLDIFGILRRKYVTYILRNGTKYRVKGNSCADYMLTEIWLHKFYTKYTPIKVSDIVVDIGSNVGIFSVFAARRARKGKVICFEPDKENYKLLEKNAKLNGLQNVVMCNLAVSNETGTKDLYLCKANSGGHSFFNKTDEKVTVRTVSLGDIFQENKILKIDFLKIDCEGAEYDILFELPKELFSKIKSISLEYHNLDKKRNANTLSKFLEKQGFRTKIEGYYLYAKRK